MRALTVLRQIWKRRRFLPVLMDALDDLEDRARTSEEVRRRMVDGVQAHDIVSSDALKELEKLRDRYKDYGSS